MLVRALVAAAAFVWVAVVPRPALAYCRLTTCSAMNAPPECFRDARGCWAVGKPLFWPQRCVSFSVIQRGSPKLGFDYTAVESMVQDSFGLWLNATCDDGNPSISVSSIGPTTCDRVSYSSTGPNSHAVLFRDGDWTGDDAEIAVTTSTFNTVTGGITNADIAINSDVYPMTEDELRYVLAHETGHFLGLDHSREDGALMFFQPSFGFGLPPVLAVDDLDGICDVYPTSRAVDPVCDYEPVKGFAPECGGNVIASCAVSVGHPATSPRETAAALAMALLLAGAILAGRPLRQVGVGVRRVRCRSGGGGEQLG